MCEVARGADDLVICDGEAGLQVEQTVSEETDWLKKLIVSICPVVVGRLVFDDRPDLLVLKVALINDLMGNFDVTTVTQFLAVGA